MTSALQRAIVADVIRQHVEDTAVLYDTRTLLTAAAHARLLHLGRCDERLAAHLDGVLVAGEAAWPLCREQLETPSPGKLFAASVPLLEARRHDLLESLVAGAESIPAGHRGVIGALAWVEQDRLRGLVASLLASTSGFRRMVGLAACAAHRVDPGLATSHWIEDPDPVVRARAWRTAGELGKLELVSTAAAVSASADEDPACRFWAAWSAVLLGDLRGALEQLVGIASSAGPFRSRALQLVLQAMSVAAGHDRLRRMERGDDPGSLRGLIRGAALVGDPHYVPWLIDLMSKDSLARSAGEAFSYLSGADLARLDLERRPPEGFESGPNDDPNDPDVALSEEEGLPWPDQQRVRAWWDANVQRFQTGVRYFMGAPLSQETCMRVLKNGYQRQRIGAAFYLSLLKPGTPLFEWRAPARRQQKLLARSS